MSRRTQNQAYQRASIRHQEKWLKEKPITEPEKGYGQYLRTMERNQGFACGWIAGVAWAKRQAKEKK